MKAITKWHIILHSTGIVLEIRSSAEIGICYGRLFFIDSDVARLYVPTI